MKGIFIITLALCLGACASPPEKTVAAPPPVDQSTGQTQASNAAKSEPSDRVYLDDYNRLPMPASARGVRVLGRNKG